MTISVLTGFALLPPVPPAGITDGTTAVDATTDYVTFVGKVPVTGTINTVYHRVAGTTLIGTLSCQIQTLDASGDPGGTAYGSCAQSDVVVAGTEDNTQITFGSLACSATAGDLVAIRIWASVVTSGSASVMSTGAATGMTTLTLPYTTERTTGTGAGTKSAAGVGPVVEYSGPAYYDWGWVPSTTQGSESVDADGSLRRIGNRFILPCSVTAYGAWAYLDWDTNNTTIKLYDTDGTTVLATATMLAAARSTTTARLGYFSFATPVNLQANTASPYRLVVETDNTSATAATIGMANAIVAAHMDHLCLGTDCYYTSHNGTSWTDTTTKRTWMGMLVSSFDDGTGMGRANLNIGL